MSENINNGNGDKASSSQVPSLNINESQLKLEQLSLQIQQARLDLRKRLRDENNAEEASQIELRQKRALADKAVLDLETAKRIAARDQALDADNCELMFCEAVNWDTAKSAISELNKLSRRFPGKPLTVTLNSPGGSVLAGLALYDHIRELSHRGHKMTVKVRGMAASMGGILLQAGDIRIIGPEALLLIHEVSSGTYGKLSDMQDSINFSRKLWDKLLKILARRSKLSDEEIKERSHKYDWWLDAEEAVALGFADKIA